MSEDRTTTSDEPQAHSCPECVRLRTEIKRLHAFMKRDGCASCAARDGKHNQPPCSVCVGLDHWTMPKDY